VRGYLRSQVPPPSAPDCCFHGRVIASNGRPTLGSNGNPVNLWAHSTCGKGPHPLLWAGSRVLQWKIIRGIPNRQYDCVIFTINLLTYLRTDYVLNIWPWSRKILFFNLVYTVRACPVVLTTTKAIRKFLFLKSYWWAWSCYRHRNILSTSFVYLGSF